MSNENQNVNQNRIADIWHRIVLPELKQTYTGVLRVLLDKKIKILDKGLFDVWYFFPVLALLVFGLAVYHSASYDIGEQLCIAIVGFVGMFFLSQLNVKVFRQLATLSMAAAFVLLVIVLFKSGYNGTHRWIDVGLFSFQPSEIAKVTYILWLSYLMDKYKDKRRKPSSFFVFFGIVLLLVLFMLLESHLSGAILFFFIGYALMWYNNMDKKWFIAFTAAIALGAAALVSNPMAFTKVPGIKDYQMARIVTWKKVFLNQELTYDEKINDARQVLQSLYGIGSGGVGGVGYGQSAQKISNLQEQGNDFIFAVLGEELGLIGGLIMLFLFGWLVVRGIQIAYHANSRFAALVALGISTQMALQVLINVSVATSLLPNTGISLPFFSGGGTSIGITLLSMGVMLAISKDLRRDNEKQKENIKEKEENAE
ncbi:MAG: FtsW/RodA/SpoVE family cell cycle protein [Clostridia bacterium]|nr:FtsW/RodA/SpoVE family cell cycle protein [Clostridia bacterium]